MLKNYFKIAFRNLARHKAFSILNISGLAIGMACSILILLWVQNELSYDKFHKNAGHIYRITVDASGFKAAVTPPGLGPELQHKIPEIKAVTRISRSSTLLLEAGNNKFEENRVFYADSNFLQVFSYPLLEGNRTTALQRPDGVLITEDMAKKYFGKKDAIGKVLIENNSDNLIVAGVLANPSPNTHLQYDFILPMSNLAKKNPSIKNNVWNNYIFYTYIQLNRNVRPGPESVNAVARHIDKIYKDRKDLTMQVVFHLQSLTDIHLSPALQIDLPGHGNIQYVNIFFIVALFILGVACINFMNLSTARSARRAKEVGLRKAIGADRRQLIVQFLGESLLISFISLVIAIGIVYAILPMFNSMSEKPLAFNLTEGSLLLKLLVIALLTGLVSGSYPALFLSGFKPVSVLKGRLNIGGGNMVFRNALVLIQFVVSIVLLVGTVVVYKQLNFIKDKNLGFDKSNLLYMNMTGDMNNKKKVLENALKSNPLTSNFTIVSELPTSLTSGSSDINWEGKEQQSQVIIPSMYVDENFTDVFQVKMVSGRSFSSAFNDTLSYVINETALKIMGFDATGAIGKILKWDNDQGKIIGVVKDFNFKPLQYAIEPLILGLSTRPGTIVIRTKPNTTPASIKALESISRELNPSYPFVYNFFDKDLEKQYRGEKQMGSIFNFFAILAIFISCLGLYGLSAFMAEQRLKEIGVRKVLGASIFNIVYLLSNNFTRLILIAVVIAVPVSWYAVDHWLQGYAYRIDVSWTVFLGASCTALFIAWITVGYESVKAAIMNPVKSLRAE